LTYQVAALLASLAAHVFIPGGFQRAFSVACGVILLAGVLRASRPSSTHVVARAWLRPILRGSAWTGRIAASHPTTSRFVGGVLNGLLPCGLTYAAVVMSAASGSAVSAALVMAGFGAGTLPALVGLSAAARPWAVLAPRLRLVTPLVVAAAGLVLLMRGLLPPQIAHASRHVAGVHLLHRP
jgi:sulfite exporter TauE/SafE